MRNVLISGIYGSNLIFLSSAKLRVQNKEITSAKIEGTEGNLIIIFDGPQAKWNKERFILSSALDPYSQRVFQTTEDAKTVIKQLGLKQ